MSDSKHAVLTMAVAVTFVAFGGLLVAFSDPTITGSTVGPPEPVDTLAEHERLVYIEPRVAAAHRYIMTNSDITIVEEQGVNYVALVHVDEIPQLSTLATVTYMNN